MLFRSLIVLLPLTIFTNLKADSVYRIEVGEDYSKYSNRDLRERVWRLERAVAQLQQKVFELQAQNTATPTPKVWTCYMQSFAQTFTATASTKSAAVADLIQQCSRRSGAIHCSEDKVKCGNE